FTRLATYGFRCAKFRSPVPEAAAEPIEFSRRNFNLEKPVSEAEFEGYRRLYSYERTPLHSLIDSVDERADYWIKQSVSFDAAYAGERVSGYLLLPKSGEPPFQAVIYFPPSGAFILNSSQGLTFEDLEFLVSGGRAVFYPVYKGTYERREESESTALVWLNSPALTDAYRNHVVMWSKDLGRSVDYLESRSDIDDQRLAYYGYSAGAVLGVILTALEGRFRASVLHSGGFEYPKTFPEVDQLNFAPRVKIPTLMLNGRYDLYFPVETSQEPMYRALGTPNIDKHHAILEAGHTVPMDELARETLAWLDRYLGSVSP
ncbi:MAG: dienelactone hydrolase family protein, partial [Acidobacteriota bacterium]